MKGKSCKIVRRKLESWKLKLNPFWSMKHFSFKMIQKKDMQLKVESSGTSVHTKCSIVKNEQFSNTRHMNHPR